MKHALIFILLMAATLLLATPRGLTVPEIPCSNEVSGTAPKAESFQPHPLLPGTNDFPKDDWIIADSFNMPVLLPAGQQYGMEFVNSLPDGIPFSSMGELSHNARQAVAKAPSFIKAELLATLLLLQPDRQVIWADLINNAVDPFVDEIAFCVATSSPEFLNSSYAYPQLFLENAQLVYSIAADLPYVEIIDTGSAIAGGNYTSTTRYARKNAEGLIEYLTIPNEIYYWYLVHPKITDEIAAYIDPAIIENNSTHVNNIAQPPTGKFWRSYLYDLTETGRPVLSDSLAICQTLFNNDGTTDDAIHRMQAWINANMSFNSNNERPHQPVRIIAKRMGRCGEYADLTTAVARIGLIPCTGIMSVSTDHTWNEFWDNGWHAWEPVNGYVNNPLVYEDGWGKVFGSVFEMRPDGLFTPVTDRYSQGEATINIQVVDSSGHPVDGARVVLAIVDGGNRYDCEQFTDNNGLASFSVGENRNYRARCETSFGLYPAQPGTYSQLVENSVDGQIYNYTFTIAAPMPIPVPEQLPTPDDPITDYRFAAVYSSPGYYISGTSLWDDISYVGTYPAYYKFMDQPATISSMVADADNLLFWEIDHIGSMYAYSAPATSGSISFSIPMGQNWYAFVDNSHHHRNALKISGEFRLEHYGTAIDDAHNAPAALKLYPNYPNPFATSTKLLLELPESGKVEMAVYNLKGQMVRSFATQTWNKGMNSLDWDGCDNKGQQLASGIYVVKAKCDRISAVRRVVLTN